MEKELTVGPSITGVRKCGRENEKGELKISSSLIGNIYIVNHICYCDIVGIPLTLIFTPF